MSKKKPGGYLYVNEKRTNDSQPTHTGPGTFFGKTGDLEDGRLAGWWDKGKKRMSVLFTPKSEFQNGNGGSRDRKKPDDDDDDIPF